LKKEHILGLLIAGGLAYFLLAKKPEEVKAEEVKPPEEIVKPPPEEIVKPSETKVEIAEQQKIDEATLQKIEQIVQEMKTEPSKVAEAPGWQVAYAMVLANIPDPEAELADTASRLGIPVDVLRKFREYAMLPGVITESGYGWVKVTRYGEVIYQYP
jgi:hypothetical protein